MKRIICLVLAMALLLAGCGTKAPKDELTFGVSVADTVAQLKEKARELPLNAFEEEPEVLDVDYGTGYAWFLGDGIRMAIYGDDEDMLTSVYLSATVEETTESSFQLLQEYSGMMLEHFVPAAELDSVVDRLGTHDEVGDLVTSTVPCSTCEVTMMGNGSTTYFSVYPVESAE